MINLKSFSVLIISIIVLVSSCTQQKTIFPSSTDSSINERETLYDSAGIESKFSSLSKARTNLCSNPSFIDSKSDDDKLQGSCCSAMDLHRYTEQVEGLKKYSYIDKVPLDPYDIPVSLVKELLIYQKNIKLTSDQQSIYNEAVKLSHENGPCCCKCWRWYAFEGLAKYLITEHKFNAEQIAEIWDLEDGCGGPGHIEGMHDIKIK